MKKTRGLQLAGQKFGRLFVLKRLGKNKIGAYQWLCLCDCGSVTSQNGSSIKAGCTKSCGCLQKELPSHLIHGGGGTRLYKIWKSMRQRCSDPNNKNYLKYGARGIKLCEEWDDFSVFREWCMSNGYDDGLQIDRINNYGNYEPSNCRWVTRIEQARNKRNNLNLSINGKTQCFAAWCEHFNVPYKRAYQQYRRGVNPFPAPLESMGEL